MRTSANLFMIPALLLAANPVLAQPVDGSAPAQAGSSPPARTAAEATPARQSGAGAGSHPGFEAGILAGVMFPPDAHNLQDERSGHLRLKDPAFEAGMRLAFLPIPYAGVEVEGAALPTSTSWDDSAALWTVRGHALVGLPIRRVTPFLLLGGGALGIASTSLGADADPALHFGVGAQLAIDRFLSVRLDVRDTLVQKNDAPDGHLTHFPELLVGLGFRIGREKHSDVPPPLAPAPPVCPPADADQDGVEDATDRCPTQAGPEPTGCPAARDTDGDGVPDAGDECPALPGTMRNGCPDPDADKDGIATPDDRCPDAPETANGFEDTDGCPDQVPSAVAKFTGAIEGIEFEYGLATIRFTSRPTLDEAADVLIANPGVRVRVVGHTDGAGDRAANAALSLRRAEAVKQYLVAKGVDAARLEVAGMGPDQPRAPNDTPAGRQRNRRIEFQLIRE